MSLSFKGHTVVVTGAGGGLGKAYDLHYYHTSHTNTYANLLWLLSYRYSLLFATRGANIVVNDFNAEAAQNVVDEIKRGGWFICRLVAGFGGSGI